MADQPTSTTQIRLPLLFAAVLALGMFIGQRLPHAESPVRFTPGATAGAAGSALDEILRYIQSRYVDSVNVESLKLGALNHLLEQLDPHSVYITREELAIVNDDMNGEFEGIGVEFIMVDDTIEVVTPLSGGPAEAAGVLAGDKIVTIEDTTVAGVKIDNGEIYRRLRGPKGSPVRIGVLRGRETTPRQFTILRDIIPVHSVEVAYMIEPRTGYVKINRFSAHTYQEFMDAVRPMVQDQSMRNLVLDLRGNPGGYLDEAVDLLGQFFSKDKLLVYTQGRTEKRRDYQSSGRAQFDIDNIAVLIDEGSASASEIVAGAVQDHDRGWIVGRRSYGKGLVQEQYPLADGGALRLTVARYYTPSGRSIQREYKNDREYEQEASRRLQSGELLDGSKVRLTDSTAYYTGLGRVVYGGGGIMPDVFVPLDTQSTNPYFFEARQQVPQFVARWLQEHDRTTLPAKLDDFVQSYAIDDAMLEEFVAYAEKQGIKRDPAQISEARNELKLQLKARIAKVLFQDVGMYRVFNDDDPAVEKAVQLMQTGQRVARR